MKKMMAALLLFVMCMGLVAPGFADTAGFAATRSFIAMLEANDLGYEFMGRASNGEEHVYMENEDENFAYAINIYFHSDNDRGSVYVWNIIEFDDVDFVNVLRAVNDLNYGYKYTRFIVDESDNTVTCAMNVIMHDNAAVGDIMLEALQHMVSILEVAYPSLAVYDK